MCEAKKHCCDIAWKPVKYVNKVKYTVQTSMSWLVVCFETTYIVCCRGRCIASVNAASCQQRLQADQQGWQLLAPFQEGLQTEP